MKKGPEDWEEEVRGWRKEEMLLNCTRRGHKKKKKGKTSLIVFYWSVYNSSPDERSFEGVREHIKQSLGCFCQKKTEDKSAYYDSNSWDSISIRQCECEEDRPPSRKCPVAVTKGRRSRGRRRGGEKEESNKHLSPKKKRQPTIRGEKSERNLIGDSRRSASFDSASQEERENNMRVG